MGETKKGGIQENSTIFSKNKHRNRGSKSLKAQSRLLAVLESRRNHRVFANENTQNPGRKAPAPCGHMEQTLPPHSQVVPLPAHSSLIWAAQSKCQPTDSYLLCAVIHEQAELCVGRVPGELWEQPALTHTSHGRRRPSVIPSILPPANFSSNATHRACLHCKIRCFEGSAVILSHNTCCQLEGKVTGGHRNPSQSLAVPKERCCSAGMNTAITT